MAVMTSASPDSGANEHKAQPVPSSDKMALDLDINGTLNNDDQSRDLAVPDNLITPLEFPTKHTSEVTNGVQNSDAFGTNNALLEPLDVAHLADDHQLTEDLFASDNVDASHSFSTLPTTQHNSLDTTSPSQIDPLVDLPPPTSSVPPVVEAQESDLRSPISPATQEKAEEVKAEKHGLDLTADSSLAGASPDTSFDDPMASLPASANSEGAAGLALAPATDEQPLHPQSVSNIDLDQTSQPDLPEPAEPLHEDTDMIDAPASPTKLARAREEDTEAGPSTKRSKTEGDSALPEFAVPEVPSSASAAQNGDDLAEPGDDLAPTPYQQKELLKVIRQQKITTAGKQFKDAVATLWPNLATAYLEKIENPMDLLIIENRLRDGQYSSIGDMKKDLSLLYNNCVIFNGADHSVTTAANTVRSNIIGKIPGPEPIKTEKKPRKSTPNVEMPREPRASAARRQSRGSAVGATSPKALVPSETFALGPSGTPLIRRDSTQIDNGRPKREIHPPKPRDLIYNARPKKKFAQELKFCDEVLTELRKPKYSQFNLPFLVPVDPVALGIPDYFKIIKNPMDLQTVGSKLTNGEITTIKEFEADVRLIFKNCYKFNPEGSVVAAMCKQLETLFDQEISRKVQWMSDHPSPNNATSPYSLSESEAEESDEEGEQSALNSSTAALKAALHARLAEEQGKLIELMSLKKPDQSLVKLQEDMIAVIKNQLDSSTKAIEKSAKPKTKAKAPKKAPPPRKKAEPAKKAYRPKNIGMAEKEQISAGISQLEGRDLEAAIAILKKDFPSLDLSRDEELDIDQFTVIALSQLHDLIIKRIPSLVPVKSESKVSTKQNRPKKNKPMSKTEQEAKIHQLKKLKDQFERQSSGSPDDAPRASGVLPTVEQNQSSGDEDSSDSEED